ncbi:hypothetical protein [Butyrivibrio sp. YAB3001]|uniref:hypothetical protein n=1 Tax=Butyrivibrio sp. YAB3001 TaxID=1520812 RepID=UPI0008F64531|nr:hypothetical protein [Butyrivibrio sp. YAB3001]SFB82473.1 hypothetical protein SAMN02910398_00760 [Butyrivibrio sp. YAB3001]
MVLVDVFVPSVDKTYNFSLNEKVIIEDVISEIVEMIEQKEKCNLLGDKKDMHLYSTRNSSMLPGKNTLIDCFVTSGTRLVLV